MDKNVLKKILKTKQVKFSMAEVEQLMDAELEKDPEEIDTELVDLCLQILTSDSKDNHSEKTLPKLKKFRYAKILIAAALAAVLLVLSLSATADKYDIDVSGNTIVQKFGKYFRIKIFEEREINLRESYPGVDLSENTLPDFLFEDNCVIIDQKSLITNGDMHIRIEFTMKDSKMNGYVNVDVPEEFSLERYHEINISTKYSRIKELNVNGIRVFVFSEDENCIIKYFTKDMLFDLHLLECEFEKAVEIANTIG